MQIMLYLQFIPSKLTEQILRGGIGIVNILLNPEFLSINYFETEFLKSIFRRNN